MKKGFNVFGERQKEVPAWMGIVIYLVLFFVFATVLSTVVFEFFKLPAGTGGMGGFSLLQLTVGQLTTLVSTFLSAIFVLRYLDHRPFSDLGFSLKGRGKDMLYGLLVAVALYGMGFGGSLALGVITVTGVQFEPMQLLGSFYFFVLVAVAEELMVRGYILGRMLRTGLNKFAALFLSSVLFAGMHLLNPNIALLPVLNLVLAGMLLGVSYLYTRNLWFPISLHLFWNWLQGPVLGYEVSGNQWTTSLLKLHLSDEPLINGGAFGFEGSILCTGLMVAFTGLIIWWFEHLSLFPKHKL